MESEGETRCESLQKIVTRLLLEKQQVKDEVKNLERKNEALTKKLSTFESFMKSKPIEGYTTLSSINDRLDQLDLWCKVTETSPNQLSQDLKNEYLNLVKKKLGMSYGEHSNRTPDTWGTDQLVVCGCGCISDDRMKQQGQQQPQQSCLKNALEATKNESYDDWKFGKKKEKEKKEITQDECL